MLDENINAVKLFDLFAEIYEQKYMNVDLYKISLDNFCIGLKRQSSILDLACGPGNILKYLYEKNLDFVLQGNDLSERMISLAKVNVPSALFNIEDCRYLNQEEKYNGVVCNFLIPYLKEKEVESLLLQIREILQKNGILLFGFITSTVNQSEKIQISSGDFMMMHFYKEQFVIELLQKNGFVINDIKSYKSPNPRQLQNDVIIVAQKNGL